MRRELKTNFGRKSFMKARLFRKNIGKALVLKKKRKNWDKGCGFEFLLCMGKP